MKILDGIRKIFARFGGEPSDETVYLYFSKKSFGQAGPGTESYAEATVRNPDGSTENVVYTLMGRHPDPKHDGLFHDDVECVWSGPRSCIIDYVLRFNYDAKVFGAPAPNLN